MINQSIISDEQALQIRKNDLRKRALEQRAVELRDASPERRSEIMAEIDRDIQKELQERATGIAPGTLLH
jgi:hypothetical protein